MRNRSTILFCTLSALVVLLFVADIAVGSVNIPLRDIWATLTGGECDAVTAKIIIDIRLIKAFVAIWQVLHYR